MNQEENIIRNQDVPIETVFRWKQVECWKLRKQNSKQAETIKALRRNLDMVLNDKELKKQIAKELLIRRKTEEINRLNKKLNKAYQSIEELIVTNIKLKQQLDERDS